MGIDVSRFRRLKWPLIVMATAILIVVVGIAGLSSGSGVVRLALPMNTPEEPIAAPTDANWPGSAGWPGSAYLALQFGHEQGRVAHIEPSFRIAGKGAVASLVDGTVDAAWTFAPPVVEMIAGGQDLLVIAVVMRSYGQARLFAQVQHADDWYTGNLSVKSGTILDSLVFAELREAGKMNNLRDGSLNLINAENPENTFFALVKKQVGAAAMPGLYGDFIESLQIGKDSPEVVEVGRKNLYRSSGMIVTTPRKFAQHRDLMLDMLRIFRDYGEYVAANPEKALADMRSLEAAGASTAIGAVTNGAWQPDDFLIQTDKATVRGILEYEAQLRVDGGVMAGLPDFEPAVAQLDYVSDQLVPK